VAIVLRIEHPLDIWVGGAESVEATGMGIVSTLYSFLKKLMGLGLLPFFISIYFH
jgi:hypothetical protein